MSVLAHHNETTADGQLVGVDEIVTRHWKHYGRNYYSRYDYENVDAQAADQLMTHLISQFPHWNEQPYALRADIFDYTDPIDHSISRNQGIRFIQKDGSRIIFRLSGTGSVGATIRIYFEQYSKDKVDEE